jgi:hypothetical protein
MPDDFNLSSTDTASEAADADVGMGAANTLPERKAPIINGVIKKIAAGQREYSMTVQSGDIVIHLARDADSYPRAVETPSHQVAKAIPANPISRLPPKSGSITPQAPSVFHQLNLFYSS